MNLIAALRSGRPATSSPTPAMWPSYAIAPTSRTRSRRSMSAARWRAWRGVRIGERFGPIFASRPPAGHQLGSMSIATRIVAPTPAAAASIRSSCAGSSTISAGCESGRFAACAARSSSASRSVVGIADEDVVEALVGQEQGLRQGEAEDPSEPVVEREDPAQYGQRAHRLRRDADRQPAGLVQHLRARWREARPGRRTRTAAPPRRAPRRSALAAPRGRPASGSSAGRAYPRQASSIGRPRRGGRVAEGTRLLSE